MRLRGKKMLKSLIGFLSANKIDIHNSENDQLCLTLCDLVNWIACAIFQTRILEWVAFPFCRVSSQPSD